MLSHLSSAFDNSRLKLFVLPTEQCNFRCVYCYEDFKEGTMKPEVVQSVLRFLDRRAPTLSRLQVEWFGGEPLLARSVIEEISRHILDLQAHHSFVFGGAMTTNGFFLDVPTMGSLIKAGTNEFQISLDGLGSVHDQTRRKAGGGGTFARIWSNLLALHSSQLDFRIMLRVHVSSQNIASLNSLVESIVCTFGGDSRFVVLFKNIQRLGGPNDGSLEVVPPLEADRIIDSLQQLLPATLLAQNNALDVCYAAEANSWVVRSNGSLAKCTVAFADPMNRIGQLQHDGTVEVSVDQLRPWLSGWATLDNEFLACPYAKLQQLAVQSSSHFAIIS